MENLKFSSRPNVLVIARVSFIIQYTFDAVGANNELVNYVKRGHAMWKKIERGIVSGAQTEYNVLTFMRIEVDQI